MEFRIIRISPKQALTVRHPVLRAGQNCEAAKLSIDTNEHTAHFGAVIGDKIVAVATIYPENNLQNCENWRLRGMATLPEFQNNGMGTLLLQSCKTYIISQNGQKLWCNARVKAVKFYQQNGFKIKSDEFDIPNIGAHFKMEKEL